MSYTADPRVLFAAERTLLAWQRSAIALMGFGFVVERFGLFLQMVAHQPAKESHRAFSLGLGVLLLLLGALMIYCFWLILATGAFWIVRMEFLDELFAGVYQTGRWPVSVYPDWLRYTLTFLVPIAFAITLPAEALTSRLQLSSVLTALGFAVLLVALSRRFWRFGLKRYSGASA